MTKNKSQKAFIQHLTLLLSFHFTEDERDSIVHDYNDYFMNEAALGKSESEICNGLQSPKDIVKELKQESAGQSHHLPALFTYDSFQIGVVFIISFALQLTLKEIGKESFLFTSVILNIIFYAITVHNLKSTNLAKPKYISHFIPICLMMLYFIAVISLSFTNNPNSGIIMRNILWIIISVSFIFGIIIILKMNKKNTYLPGTLIHLSGLITICFNFMNSQGILTFDIPSNWLIKIMLESIALYLLTLLLCTGFYYKNKKRGFTKWTHN